jgi:hypothetical protein
MNEDDRDSGGHPKISVQGTHVDITMRSDLQVGVSIRADQKVIWINTQNGCLVRICGIKGGVTVIGGRCKHDGP